MERAPLLSIYPHSPPVGKRVHRAPRFTAASPPEKGLASSYFGSTMTAPRSSHRPQRRDESQNHTRPSANSVVIDCALDGSQNLRSPVSSMKPCLAPSWTYARPPAKADAKS